jgi:hypothetical protein
MYQYLDSTMSQNPTIANVSTQAALAFIIKVRKYPDVCPVSHSKISVILKDC